MRNELNAAQEEKASLEEEIKVRNEEVYKMNEKMIFLEYEKQAEANKQLANMGENNQVQGLKSQLDKYQNNNIRRIMDLQKLRKCLNRLRNDLYVFKLSKKLQNESQKAQVQPAEKEKEASFQEDDELA